MYRSYLRDGRARVVVEVFAVETGATTTAGVILRGRIGQVHEVDDVIAFAPVAGTADANVQPKEFICDIRSMLGQPWSLRAQTSTGVAIASAEVWILSLSVTPIEE